MYFTKPRYSRKFAPKRTQYKPARAYKLLRRGRFSRLYPQPALSKVYIEEPDTDSESSESEYDAYEVASDDDVVYVDDSESELDIGDVDSEDSEYEQVFVIADDLVDVNDVLAQQALDEMEADGLVRDVNNDLLRYYDSDSELDSDGGDLILIAESDGSVTDLEMDSDDELELVRQNLADELVSSDEDADSWDEEDVFFEVDSDFHSDSDSDESAVMDLDSSDSDSESDGEGITIYRHRFDLPDRYDSDNDSTDEELVPSDDELFYAEDSDDECDRNGCTNCGDSEYQVIDLTSDLKDSKDCEVVEVDDKTYKLTVRLPSMVKEELNVKYLKSSNEVVITGKFNFGADSDDDEDYKSAEELGLEESDKESEKSESDKESDRESDRSESESDSESDSDKEEEVLEDVEDLIKDFENQEIQFEKHFQFDKVIDGSSIKATFLLNGELEVVIPNTGESVEASDSVSIAVDSE